jgi:hypothetical protein
MLELEAISVTEMMKYCVSLLYDVTVYEMEAYFDANKFIANQYLPFLLVFLFLPSGFLLLFFLIMSLLCFLLS